MKSTAMDEKTQEELRDIYPSRYNLQVKFEDVVYRAYFVRKIYYYHPESFDEFKKNKSTMLYCAQYNPETGRLKNNRFLLEMPKRERQFIFQWNIKQWSKFISIVQRRDKAVEELEQITKALKFSSHNSKSLKKLAKERTQGLKAEVKETDKELSRFYLSVRESVLEKAIFN